MNKLLQRKGRLSIFFVLLLFIFSCSEHHVYQGDGEGEKQKFNDFDFSTIQEVDLQVAYQNMGGIEAAVYFEVYDEMPVENKGYAYVKKEDVLPLYGYTTGEDGTFNKKLKLPAYAKTLYIYTPAFYAQTLIEAPVENGIAIATDMVPGIESAGTKATTSGRYTSQAYTKDGWKDWLGNWDKDGYVQYIYKGSELKYYNPGKLYTAHASVLNVNGKCPEKFRMSKDFYVSEDGEVAVTLLGGNTCWNSSLGYYYYKDGEEPASLQDVHVVMLFPNTQDGQWSINKTAARATRGVDRGTVVQLKYYPNIANGSKAGETTVFPEGYRIGFVLATNAWTNRVSGFTGDKKYRAATSKNLSVNNNGVPYNEPRTAVYHYQSGGMDAIIFSFEDHTDDENFSDVVFAVKSNPVDMLTEEIPEVKEDKQTIKTRVGVYAFEDMWPQQYDYDMNDVVVNVSYEKTIDGSAKDRGIYTESFTFKPFENVAINTNGLGVTLEDAGEAELSFTLNGEKAEVVKKDGNVILLTNNIKEGMGKEYKLTLTYQNPVQKEQANAKVFIWKEGAGAGNWEVHLSKEAPTALADRSELYFGQKDDRSDLVKGIYYVCEGNYPFAIFLSGCTEGNIGKLLLPENETHPVNTVYPNYTGWVNSNGEKYQDWYK